MVTIQNIRESVNAMPEDASVDDVIERLLYLQALDDSMEQVQNGQFYTHAEVKTYIKTKWLNK